MKDTYFTGARKFNDNSADRAKERWIQILLYAVGDKTVNTELNFTRYLDNSPIDTIQTFMLPYFIKSTEYTTMFGH